MDEKHLTASALERYWASAPAKRPWIRVGMDTGGIAAGARHVYNALIETRDELGLTLEVQRSGSLGLSYADPVVMVARETGAPVVFGAMDPGSARELISRFCRDGMLLEDRVIASRDRGKGLEGKQPVAILVKDTGEGKAADRTGFFQELIREELAVHGLDQRVQVYRALDMGLYERGICVQLLPSRVTYANVSGPDIRRIIKESLLGGQVLEDLLETGGDPQERIVLRNCGHIDPDDLESYLRAGGYRGLKRALLEMSPEQVIEEMKTSGLRGRGGAGYPTWLKWKKTREPVADRKFVICNADEGDPGAFMDRSVLEADPHSVLEGLLISAYAIGAEKGFFYVRAEYPLAVERIQRAIGQSRAAGLLGKDIIGSGFSFDAEVRLGAGAFVCGEETALIASIEGRRGSPEPRPPYPSVKGLWDMPTSINNVETLAAVSAILDRGGPWYAGFGTEKSRGTKVFAVTGKVRNPQLVEVPMGIPIRTVIESICGGASGGSRIKAVQTGGPSGGVIPLGKMDTPVTYESLHELGSIMGSGGMLVMDESDCMVDVAKFYLGFCVDESCGKCAPCRIGGFQMLRLLEKVHSGKGTLDDLETIRDICHCMRTASLCGLGQTVPNPVLSTLRYFEHEYIDFINGRGFSRGGQSVREPAVAEEWERI
ncbi:MAG: NADH-ubiquinone oxidoreductase-F iron-sulfur binding region domain-containing protein [Opitutaceae bacterium]